MRDNYYRLGEGFLIVYSITMRDTFTDVNRFHDHILSVKGVEDVPLIVVGSKCDLDGDREVLLMKKRAIKESKQDVIVRCQRQRERRWPRSLMCLFSRHLQRRE
jgi:GTPase SAR1 family protein